MSNGSCQVGFAFENIQINISLFLTVLPYHALYCVTCDKSISRWCGGFADFGRIFDGSQLSKLNRLVLDRRKKEILMLERRVDSGRNANKRSQGFDCCDLERRVRIAWQPFVSLPARLRKSREPRQTNRSKQSKHVCSV